MHGKICTRQEFRSQDRKTRQEFKKLGAVVKVDIEINPPLVGNNQKAFNSYLHANVLGLVFAAPIHHRVQSFITNYSKFLHALT